MRLLLTEDDPMLGKALTQDLAQLGYAADWAQNARLARQLMSQEAYQIAVLDIGLPDGDGLELVRQWRAQGLTLPILLLTARDRWQDKVMGLEAGADDYLTKPFHSAELAARLQALVRRAHGQVQPLLVAGQLSLDERRQQVMTPNGQWHPLTGTEFRLLRCLMHSPGRVFSKEALIEQLYNIDSESSNNLIEVYVARLRRLLGPQSIKTLRGQGYVFPETAAS